MNTSRERLNDTIVVESYKSCFYALFTVFGNKQHKKHYFSISNLFRKKTKYILNNFALQKLKTNFLDNIFVLKMKQECLVSVHTVAVGNLNAVQKHHVDTQSISSRVKMRDKI